MQKKLGKLTNKELANLLDKLYNGLAPETPEEVDAVLREFGYDPDEVGARMKAIAEKALNEAAGEMK